MNAADVRGAESADHHSRVQRVTTRDRTTSRQVRQGAGAVACCHGLERLIDCRAVQHTATNRGQTPIFKLRHEAESC